MVDAQRAVLRMGAEQLPSGQAVPVSVGAEPIAEVESRPTQLRPLRRREIAPVGGALGDAFDLVRQVATASGRSDMPLAVRANGCRNGKARSTACPAPRSGSYRPFDAVSRSPKFIQNVFIKRQIIFDVRAHKSSESRHVEKLVFL